RARSVIAGGQTELRFALGDRDLVLPLSEQEGVGLLAGRSPAMRAVFAVLERVPPPDTTVLLEIQTGTGRELAAESLHRAGARRDGPFVVVDCAGMPASL